MLFSFGLVTECCLHNYTKRIGVWHLVQRRIECWRKNAFSHNNDAQSVANGDRRRVEIELCQCDIC